VDTDHLSAFRAGPAPLFPGDELLEPEFADVAEIFDHAHTVFRPVAIIQLAQPRAGEGGARKTEFPPALLHSGAKFNTARHAMIGFVDIGFTAPRARLSFPQMADTERTIHPAGGDHYRRDGIRHIWFFHVSFKKPLYGT
jgi:hypothetical protein